MGDGYHRQDHSHPVATNGVPFRSQALQVDASGIQYAGMAQAACLASVGSSPPHGRPSTTHPPSGRSSLQVMPAPPELPQQASPNAVATRTIRIAEPYACLPTQNKNACKDPVEMLGSASRRGSRAGVERPRTRRPRRSSWACHGPLPLAASPGVVVESARAYRQVQPPGRRSRRGRMRRDGGPREHRSLRERR